MFLAPVDKAVVVAAERQGLQVAGPLGVSEGLGYAHLAIPIGIPSGKILCLVVKIRDGKSVGTLGSDEALAIDHELVLFGDAAKHRVVVQHQAAASGADFFHKVIGSPQAGHTATDHHHIENINDIDSIQG